MKNNKLILSVFLAIATIFFNSCGASSPSDSTSIEKVEGSNESIELVGDVTIGTQVWFSKNLNVSTYRNGDLIPQVQDENEWRDLTTGAWCYYKNDASNGEKYGKLYNWYAVNDPRGLAPNGYHIPTDAEWTKLADYLGGEDAAGTKMKSTSGWKNDGGGTNESGFSGLPGGNRYTGNGSSVGFDGFWWSSTENHTNSALLRQLYCDKGNILRNYYTKKIGLSVRCLRD